MNTSPYRYCTLKPPNSTQYQFNFHTLCVVKYRNTSNYRCKCKTDADVLSIVCMARDSLLNTSDPTKVLI